MGSGDARLSSVYRGPPPDAMGSFRRMGLMPQILECGVFLMTTDRRVIRTRKALLEALREMICQYPAGAITVKALSERAGINRKTFYLHFETLDSLFDCALDEVVAAYMAEMKKLPVPVDMDRQTEVFFTFYCRQPPYVERLICDPSYSEYCSRLNQKAIRENQKRCHPNGSRPLPEQKLITAFVVTASIVLYRQWVQDGKRMPVEQLAQIGCRLISYGYKGLTGTGTRPEP